MTTKYKILFMVELLNEYYRNQQCQDFSVVPSEETAVFLKNQQMLYKFLGNKLIILVKVHSAGTNADKLFKEIDTEKKFLFYLQLNKPVFNTVTSLDTDRLASKHRFYFTNLHENKSGTTLNLTASVDAYNNASPYKPGDLVHNGAGTVFECIKNSAGGNNTGNANFWHQRGAHQYVSAKDMVPFVTRIKNYTVSVAAKQFDIRVFGLNTANGQYDKEIFIEKNRVTSDTDTATVQADLSGLTPGRYKVQINTDEFDVFVDDFAVYRNVFGVIEIFSHLPAASDFALLDNSGKTKDKIVAGKNQWLLYTVRFANRLAYWKYMTPRHGVTSIDGSPGYSFNPTPLAGTPKEFFTSNKPVPLTEKPTEFKVMLTAPVSNDPPLAPNPDPFISGMLSRSEPEKDYYCTIHINY